ncbi:hypothetical protein GGQ80_001319 [Sphingomonas jinjuensis]|uniref:DUF6265 domain-containing protein n=1 Tax=Sphingomonas jinjuensis TaxID=535907 RepID=A0A840FCX5_9SPHN|nr:DUF6265 family protein [Sphingomonas jinjuensis]MBB4153417.1 hypothetical protein [Sphingomonas jinjuensis]
MLLLFAAIASSSPGQVRDLSWLAGHWSECSSRGVTSETWTDARGGVMLGVSKAIRAGRTDWESMRIDTDAEGVALFASPKGQPSKRFRATSIAAGYAVFENTGHDFPQRVIYTRREDRLVGRIEGTINGEPRSIEWHYRAVALNDVCPVATP